MQKENRNGQISLNFFFLFICKNARINFNLIFCEKSFRMHSIFDRNEQECGDGQQYQSLSNRSCELIVYVVRWWTGEIRSKNVSQMLRMPALFSIREEIKGFLYRPHWGLFTWKHSITINIPLSPFPLLLFVAPRILEGFWRISKRIRQLSNNRIGFFLISKRKKMFTNLHRNWKI